MKTFWNLLSHIEVISEKTFNQDANTSSIYNIDHTCVHDSDIKPFPDQFQIEHFPNILFLELLEHCLGTQRNDSENIYNYCLIVK
jgi:hypothetical protein